MRVCVSVSVCVHRSSYVQDCQKTPKLPLKVTVCVCVFVFNTSEEKKKKNHNKTNKKVFPVFFQQDKDQVSVQLKCKESVGCKKKKKSIINSCCHQLGPHNDESEGATDFSELWSETTFFFFLTQRGGVYLNRRNIPEWRENTEISRHSKGDTSKTGGHI